MNAQSPAAALSPYSSSNGKKSTIETHTLSVLVDNEPGVLARVVGLFSGRGYNIECLTVAEAAHAEASVAHHHRHHAARRASNRSRTSWSVLCRSTRSPIFHCGGGAMERELAMVKVKGKGENRTEAMRLAEAFRARVIDATTESFVFELTGAPKKIDDFIELMRPIGLVEVSRTGVAAIARGPEGM